ncbi:hypothetical protein ACJX0J_025666, partial [Zea mays]
SNNLANNNKHLIIEGLGTWNTCLLQSSRGSQRNNTQHIKTWHAINFPLILIHFYAHTWLQYTLYLNYIYVALLNEITNDMYHGVLFNNDIGMDIIFMNYFAICFIISCGTFGSLSFFSLMHLLKNILACDDPFTLTKYMLFLYVCM